MNSVSVVLARYCNWRFAHRRAWWLTLVMGTVANARPEPIPTWSSPGVYQAGAYPYGVAAADLVGSSSFTPDGYPDIAVVVGQLDVRNGSSAEWTGNTAYVRVYRNLAVWSDPAAGLLPLQDVFLDGPTCGAEVEFVDMNGDDRPDLVITATDDNDPNSGALKGVFVSLWNPLTNVFMTPLYTETPQGLRGLTTADFDHDGDMDVAVAVDFTADTGAPVYVFKNNGEGVLTLEEELITQQELGTSCVVAGHFDKTPGGSLYPDVFTSLPVLSGQNPKGLSWTNNNFDFY